MSEQEGRIKVAMNLARHPHDQVADFSRMTGIRDPRVDAWIYNYDLHRRYGMNLPGIRRPGGPCQVVRPQRYSIGLDPGIREGSWSAITTFFWDEGQFFLLDQHRIPPYTGTVTTTAHPMGQAVSHSGLGDTILAEFDEAVARLQARRSRLRGSFEPIGDLARRPAHFEVDLRAMIAQRSLQRDYVNPFSRVTGMRMPGIGVCLPSQHYSWWGSRIDRREGSSGEERVDGEWRVAPLKLEDHSEDSDDE